MTLVHLTVKESRTLRGRGLRKYVKRITKSNIWKLQISQETIENYHIYGIINI